LAGLQTCSVVRQPVSSRWPVMRGNAGSANHQKLCQEGDEQRELSIDEVKVNMKHVILAHAGNGWVRGRDRTKELKGQQILAPGCWLSCLPVCLPAQLQSVFFTIPSFPIGEKVVSDDIPFGPFPCFPLPGACLVSPCSPLSLMLASEYPYLLCPSSHGAAMGHHE